MIKFHCPLEVWRLNRHNNEKKVSKFSSKAFWFVWELMWFITNLRHRFMMCGSLRWFSLWYVMATIHDQWSLMSTKQCPMTPYSPILSKTCLPILIAFWQACLSITSLVSKWGRCDFEQADIEMASDVNWHVILLWDIPFNSIQTDSSEMLKYKWSRLALWYIIHPLICFKR